MFLQALEAFANETRFHPPRIVAQMLAPMAAGGGRRSDEARTVTVLRSLIFGTLWNNTGSGFAAAVSVSFIVIVKWKAPTYIFLLVSLP